MSSSRINAKPVYTTVRFDDGFDGGDGGGRQDQISRSQVQQILEAGRVYAITIKPLFANIHYSISDIERVISKITSNKGIESFSDVHIENDSKGLLHGHAHFRLNKRIRRYAICNIRGWHIYIKAVNDNGWFDYETKDSDVSSFAKEQTETERWFRRINGFKYSDQIDPPRKRKQSINELYENLLTSQKRKEN